MIRTRKARIFWRVLKQNKIANQLTERQKVTHALGYLFLLQQGVSQCLTFSNLKKAPERQLTDPSQLLVGDMLTVIDSFAYPSWLKGQTLRVIDVQTYQYQRSAEYELVLESESGQVVFLQIESDDGEQWANFAIKIQRDDVDEIFTLDEFARIFDEDELTAINVQNSPERFSHFFIELQAIRSALCVLFP